MKKLVVFLFYSFVLLIAKATSSYAGVPLNNLEGVGGVAFNPLAYPAGNPFETPGDKSSGFCLADVFTKPQIGAWYVNLSDSSIDWTTISIAQSIFKRMEISYGHETISPKGKNIHKHNFGAKLLVLEENFNDWDLAPAVSIGTIWKHTTFDTPANVDSTGIDFYIVATKFIKELPKPVLLSGGLLSTKGRILGVHGFDNDRDEVFFGNVDVMLLENLAVGFEHRQGAHFDTFKNADYWETHIAWFVNKSLTFVAAYVNAGDHKSSSKVGLGDGVVLSVQYAF